MSETTRARATATSPWPRRFAASALLSAVPLVFFGGSVTTLHAGLAIDGWLVLEPGRGDHFLWLYPVDKWFRDVGTFVEHTHRLLGSLVGILAIATVVATWATDRRRLPRVLSLAALLAVITQGVIGGFRVLERSEDLAFLHGAIAQGVFAVLGASWIASTRRAQDLASAPSERDAGFGRRLRRLSIAAVASVCLQIVAGAWLRHGGGNGALAVHLALALPVLILVPLLARRLPAGGERRWLNGSLGGQVVLGIAALVVVSVPGGEGLGAAVFPTLHVVGGGVLLLACVASSMRAHAASPSRTVEPERAVEPSGREQWEAAR
ncbi:MAG: COX15/CtaA family protein [Planctomycetota bacterium]